MNVENRNPARIPEQQSDGTPPSVLRDASLGEWPVFQSPQRKDSAIRESRILRFVLVATIVACVGDFCMLWSAPARESGYRLFSLSLLCTGGILGLASIPFYALGYAVLGRLVSVQSRVLGKTIHWAGWGIACFGSLIHVSTALSLATRSGIVAFMSLTDTDPCITALWLAATLVFFVLVTAYCAAMAGRGAWKAAALNPITLTIVAALPGIACEGFAFSLIPAAPNLAHLAFFGWVVPRLLSANL